MNQAITPYLSDESTATHASYARGKGIDHPSPRALTECDTASPDLRQRVASALNGPVAAALLVGANVSALQGSPKWTLGYLTAAVGAKHAVHVVSASGYAMLAATGVYCGVRYAHGASPWLDVPVALAGIAVCIKQSELFDAWAWLPEVRLRDDAAVYTSYVETDKILLGSLALLMHQMEASPHIVPNPAASLAIGFGTIAALMGAGTKTAFSSASTRAHRTGAPR